jgi:nitrile hydratase
MNGIHDMGGMDGMGSIEPEPNEPVFHEPWEGRVLALLFTIGPWSRGRNWGSFRFELESIPAADYLRMSYYERWFVALLVNRLLRSNLVTPAELENGEADPNLPRPTLLPASTGASPESAQLDVPVSPRFRPEQRVRARNMHPPGHIRLPRYTRGKRGTVVRDHGIFALQDTDVNGQRLDDRPQHVYTVHFTARELWGDRASARDAIYVDLWEDYLEPA